MPAYFGRMDTELTASKEVVSAQQAREDERRKRSHIDRILLKNARRSIEEMAELTGLYPDEIAGRLEALLRSRDFLSDRQEERLILIEIGDLIDDMRGRMEGAHDDNYADIANVTLRGYEAIAKRLDARRKLAELDISEITRAQGDLFLSIVLEAVNIVASELEETHPDASWDIRAEIEASFARALPAARDEVNRRVRE